MTLGILNEKADMAFALRSLQGKPTFTLLYAQTSDGDRFWKAWDAYCRASERRIYYNEEIVVPAWLRESPGFNGIGASRQLHYNAHKCKPDSKCKRCGCFCVYHEIGGPCFARHSLVSFNDPDPRRHPDGSPRTRRALDHRFCDCPGFVRR